MKRTVPYIEHISVCACFVLLLLLLLLEKFSGYVVGCTTVVVIFSTALLLNALVRRIETCTSTSYQYSTLVVDYSVLPL